MDKIKRISAFKEWKILCRQYRIIVFSDVKNLAIMIAFPVIASLIIIWIAGENMFVHYEGTKSACFVVVSAAIWGGLFNSIQTVVKERANIKRDYTTGLRLKCYIASRALIQFALCIFQSAILCTCFIGIGLKYGNELPKNGIFFKNALLEYYVSVLLLMFVADCLGLMISCMVRKVETANVMAPYILIIQLIFSGILFTMKGSAEKVSYLMISRWGMEALGSTSDLNSLQLKIQMQVPSVEHEAENMFEHSITHICIVWMILVLFIVFFLVMGDVLLHRVSKDSR
jgi:hypothetical protein